MPRENPHKAQSVFAGTCADVFVSAKSMVCSAVQKNALAGVKFFDLAPL